MRPLCTGSSATPELRNRPIHEGQGMLFLDQTPALPWLYFLTAAGLYIGPSRDTPPQSPPPKTGVNQEPQLFR